jgi:hypothetical protein
MRRVTDVVIDRDDVHRTSINGPQWFEEDFEDEVEENDEVEDEVDGEPAVAAAAQVAVTTPPKKSAKIKHVSVEEARMRVQGVVRNWLLETVGKEAAAKPG